MLLCYLLMAKVLSLWLKPESESEKVSSFGRSVMEVPRSVVELRLKVIKLKKIFLP